MLTKRYTTLVHMQFRYDGNGGKQQIGTTHYGVFDNKTNTECVVIGFKPKCYKDIKNKANELNTQ